MTAFRNHLGMDTSTIGQRLRAEREARKVSREDLAKVMGVAVSTLSDLELERSQSTTKLHRAAEFLKVSAKWLETGKGPKEVVQVDDEWPDILAYRTPASLGDGAEVDEWMETHKLKFRVESLQRKRLRADQLGVVFGRGDSMLPRIRSGDAIMFDKRKIEPVDGGLFVVTYDGALLAKQLSNLGGRWFIESLNKDDPKWRKPVPIDETKGFQIHGKVVWIGSWED